MAFKIISGKKLLIATAGTAVMVYANGCFCIGNLVTTPCGSGECGEGGEGGEGGAGGDITLGVGGAGGAGGAGGGAPCLRCAEYITESIPDDKLCTDNGPNPPSPQGSSDDLFTKLATCICGDPADPSVDSACGASSKTNTSCADNACAGKDATPACSDCFVFAEAMGACKDVYNDCANDF